MLKLTIASIEIYDEIKNEFTTTKEQTLQLEHSLVSLSKWESRFKKPFLSKEQKTDEELRYYVKCMTTTQNVDDNVYLAISSSDMKKIMNYIDDSMTATTVSNRKKNSGRDIITAEIIYYWMITLNIPFECQKWHLNRLLTLISVCDIKSSSGKKMSRSEIMRQNSAVNAMRRQRMRSRG